MSSGQKGGHLPIQQRIKSLLQQGSLQAVYDLSHEYVRTVGDMLSDYQLVLAQWEETNPELLRKLIVRTWDRLDKSTQRRFMHLMINMIHRVAKSKFWKAGVTTGEVQSQPFDFEGDEIDLDKTMESAMDNPIPSYDNIYVLDRKKRKKSTVLVMDVSGSMQGEKLSMAAIAVASIAMNLDQKDEYSVVLFSEQVNILKRVDQQTPLDEVIRNVLEILPGGRTNIGLGLLAGLKEINRSTTEQKTAILLTDGQQNTGQDPVPLARKFPQLHVINLPGGKPSFAQEIARCGRGHFISLTNMLDVPKAILECLA